jgi:hypothetical protein
VGPGSLSAAKKAVDATSGDAKKAKVPKEAAAAAAAVDAKVRDVCDNSVC